MGKRNRYIHDAWGTPDSKGDEVRSGPLPLKEGASRQIELTELKRVIDDIRTLITELRQTVDVIHSQIWPEVAEEQRKAHKKARAAARRKAARRGNTPTSSAKENT